MAEGPKFRLEQDHYLGDQYLGAGTVVGEGTMFPFTDEKGNNALTPSMHMTPLNSAAEELVKKLKGRIANPVDSLPVKGEK